MAKAFFLLAAALVAALALVLAPAPADARSLKMGSRALKWVGGGWGGGLGGPRVTILTQPYVALAQPFVFYAQPAVAYAAASSVAYSGGGVAYVQQPYVGYGGGVGCGGVGVTCG